MPTRAEVQRIQSLTQKKFRQKYGLFRAEGDKLVRALLASGWAMEGLYGTEAWWTAFGEAERWQRQLGARAERCSPATLQRISGQVQPNGVVAVARIPEQAPLPDQGWTLALDRIRDPGNMGTILRTADWFGASVLCSPDCVDRFNPKVVQASMGALFRVPLQEAELAPCLQGDPRPVFAAVLEGQAARRIHWPEAGILLIGNEAMGVDPTLPRDHSVRIGRGMGVKGALDHAGEASKEGTVEADAESLNAAVAAAILLARAVAAV